MTESRRIIHLDLDAFFCAVEEKYNPELKGKAFAVGGRPNERGVVASCSYPARQYGIHSAMPMGQAVRLYPDLEIVSSRHHSYSDESRVVMNYLRSITDVFQQISVDEAFMDITHLEETTEALARSIQDKIRNEFQLPNSIGAASNKLVAKIANDYGKKAAGTKGPPNAITIVPPGEEESFLAPLPVDMLWGVGPKTSEKLGKMGIRTIGDLAAIPDREMGERFGKHGWDLARRARGIDDRPVETHHETKSVSQETTFATDISDRTKLHEVLVRLSGRVAKRLEKKDFSGRTIKIKVRYADFTTFTRQTSINRSTNDEKIISNVAIQLFDEAWDRSRRIRLLGVGVAGLNEQTQQLGLWDRDWRQESIVVGTVTELQKRYGKKLIHRGMEKKDAEAGEHEE